MVEKKAKKKYKHNKKRRLTPKTRRILIVCVTAVLLALFSFVAFDLITVEELAEIIKVIRAALIFG